jgi:hypothetical protein
MDSKGMKKKSGIVWMRVVPLVLIAAAAGVLSIQAACSSGSSSSYTSYH